MNFNLNFVRFVKKFVIEFFFISTVLNICTSKSRFNDVSTFYPMLFYFNFLLIGSFEKRIKIQILFEDFIDR